MDLQTIITYNNKEHTLYDVMFIVLCAWHKTNTDKYQLIEMLVKSTPLPEIEVIDWIIELRPPDIQEWADTELGKQYIK